MSVFYSTRPRPFAGMLIYAERSCAGREVWWRLTDPNEDARQTGAVWMLVDTEGVTTTQYVTIAVSETRVSETYRLPGEPGCPPIPSRLRRAYRPGDLYYFFNRAVEKWQVSSGSEMDSETGAFIFKSGKGCIPDFGERALYRPPDGAQIVESGISCICSLPDLVVTGIGSLVIHSCRKCKREVV